MTQWGGGIHQWGQTCQWEGNIVVELGGRMSGGDTSMRGVADCVTSRGGGKSAGA